MSDDNDQYDDEEDIILSELNDEELVEQMHDDLYNGLKDEIFEGTTILLERGWAPDKVLAEFVPEVLMAANAMKAGMGILRPLLAETGAETIGKMVIGTVKGDIHDIGKNLVGMMMEGAGFEVIESKACATTSSCWSGALRLTKSLAKLLVLTPTAATRR